MIPLTDIIHKLSKEEQAKFSNFIKKSGKSKQSRKYELFKLILDEKFPAREFPKRIYGKENKVAYHQLRKRLFDDLIKFIALERFNSEEEQLLEITQLILAGKHLIINKNYASGFKLLYKAEEKSIAESDSESLNEIYNLLIQFSHYNPEIDLENTIKKLERNRVLMIEESNLNMAYASVKEIFHTYHQKGIEVNFDEILSDVFHRFQISEKSGNNFKTLYQLVQIVAANANVTKEYHMVAPFVLERYSKISQKEEEQNRYVFFHVKLLYFIANVLFREKRFEESNQFLSNMEKLLSAHTSYQKVFETKILVLKALNTNYQGNNSAAEKIIEEALHSKSETSKDYLDAMVVSSMIYFHQKNYKKVKSIYSKLRATDTWYIKKMGVNWLMNKNLIEILTHIELENLDYVDSRLESFLNKHEEYLNHDQRARTYLQFLKISYQHPSKVQTEEFKSNFFNSVEKKPRLQEDIYVLSFLAYLKAKMLGKETYETTLELVRGIS
jgi:hypothetical protein